MYFVLNWNWDRSTGAELTIKKITLFYQHSPVSNLVNNMLQCKTRSRMLNLCCTYVKLLYKYLNAYSAFLYLSHCRWVANSLHTIAGLWTTLWGVLVLCEEGMGTSTAFHLISPLYPPVSFAFPNTRWLHISTPLPPHPNTCSHTHNVDQDLKLRFSIMCYLDIW